MVVARGLEGGQNRDLLLNGCKISVLQDEEFWRWMVVTVAEQYECIISLNFKIYNSYDVKKKIRKHNLTYAVRPVLP